MYSSEQIVFLSVLAGRSPGIQRRDSKSIALALEWVLTSRGRSVGAFHSETVLLVRSEGPGHVSQSWLSDDEKQIDISVFDTTRGRG